jgi:GNAT superfamily N-acetyltransferase
VEISQFRKEHIPEAAALFVQNYRRLRLAVPVLPDLMEDQRHVEEMLATCFDPSSGIVAWEQDRLVGYVCWFLVERFRETERKGAYVPEWGHGCVEDNQEQIIRAMYRAAGESWAAAGCQVHAITLLADDGSAEKAWFWNGFGLTVVDAIRPMNSLQTTSNSNLLICKATQDDVEALTELDKEHWKHYSRSPIFMPPRPGKSLDENIEFLSRPKNSIWIAWDGNVLAGFIRYEGYDFDSAAILESEDGITITGAYVRPAYRGQKVAVALLDAALRDYQARGLKYCAVNFESFNPEAASFWMKYFKPVCFSLLRVPESI